jgi:hypothetical protein
MAGVAIMRVEQRRDRVAVFVEGLIERLSVHTDIDEARAAAELLAEERGEAMSQAHMDPCAGGAERELPIGTWHRSHARVTATL